MPPVGFEPKMSSGERPQTYSLDRAATDTGIVQYYPLKILEYTITIITVNFISCYVNFIRFKDFF